MDEEKRPGLDRRTFLKSAAATTAAAVTAVAPAEAGAQLDPGLRRDDKGKGGNDASTGDPIIERPGSDFMIDVIKTLDLEYLATNPGSSFRSLHESLVNYGGNTKPELLTCMHEEA